MRYVTLQRRHISERCRPRTTHARQGVCTRAEPCDLASGDSNSRAEKMQSQSLRRPTEKSSSRARAALRAKQTRLAEALDRRVGRLNHPKPIVTCVPRSSTCQVRAEEAARSCESRCARVPRARGAESASREAFHPTHPFSSPSVERTPHAVPIPAGRRYLRGDASLGSHSTVALVASASRPAAALARITRSQRHGASA